MIETVERNMSRPLHLQISKVLVDGKDISRVYAIDFQNSTVWRYRTDESDRILIADGKPLTESIVGKIEVVRYGDPQHASAPAQAIPVE